jgi:hypothetical protein
VFRTGFLWAFLCLGERNIVPHIAYLGKELLYFKGRGMYGGNWCSLGGVCIDA